MFNLSGFTVYSASAGSGKTFTLVKEYLKIILSNTDVFYFQKILAITFTNKAAAEMKERILYNLQCFARKENTPMWYALLEEIDIDPAILHRRAAKITEAIIENYSAFSITTIDSFTHKIIRTFAYDFGLSLDFEVELDSGKLLHEAVDAVIDQIGVNPDLSKALIAFSLQKSNEDKTWNIEHSLFDFASILLNETNKASFAELEKIHFSKYQLLQKNIERKQQIIGKELQQIGEVARKLLQNNRLPEDIFLYRMLPNFFNALYSKKDVYKVIEDGKLLKRFEENTLIKKSCNDIERLSFEEHYQELFDLYLQAERLYHKQNLLNLFKESVIPLAVLSYVNKALEQLKSEQNIQLISEFNELIFNKIQDEPTPYIYERLGEKYLHYFIDEMQDTSVLQWNNLAKLIENAISQEGGTLLLVGDAKQAIYRWRGGASEQFIELSDKNNSAPFSIPKNSIHLDTNYRSYSEIIDFNNRFFQHIAGFLQNETYKKLYLAGNKQQRNTKKGGYIQLEFVDLETEDIEKDLLIPDKVLQTIQELGNNFDKKDICILVRKRKDAIAVAQYLSEHKIPIISSETLLLANNAKVLFIMNLLQFIHQNEDREKAVLLLDFLYHHANLAIDKHRFISELIHLSETDFYKELRHFGFSFDLEVFHQKNLYDAVEYCIRAFHLINTPNAYVQSLLQTLIDFQIQKGSDLSGFIDYWYIQKEKLSIQIPEGKNAIQIMTIHKAKGLQFPVVIFPYDLNIYQQINPKVWYPIDNPEDFEGFPSLYIPFSKKLQNTSTLGSELYQNRREILELDNFNLLYVALTRAVEQLYIITPYKKQEKTSYYSGLFIDFLKTNKYWQEEKRVYSFGEKHRKISTEKQKNHCHTNNIIHSESKRFISTDIKEHQVAIYTKSSLLWGTEQGEAIAYGNLLHEILAHIKTIDDVDAAIQLFQSQGIIDTSQIESIRTKIRAIVTHPRLKAYYQQDCIIFNEREIVTDESDIIIPDRLVLFPDNTMVIIDYKTGAKDTKHLKQVQHYSDVLSKMGYAILKKILIYIKDKSVDVEVIA